MRERLAVPVSDCLARPEAIAAALDLPADAPADDRFTAACDSAIGLLAKRAAPAGLWEEIDRDEFGTILCGEGRNAESTPLETIYPRAERLALFAVTVGGAVSDEISKLFESGEFLLGLALDAAASETAERLAEAVELRAARAFGMDAASDRRLAMRYSPGYCGWDLSGQRSLFARLRPEEIGLSLSPSMLMIPLKSISGVILGGPPDIHVFDDVYPFCGECRNRTCRERVDRARSAAGYE